MVSPKIILACLKNEQKAQKALYEASAPYVYTIIKNYIRGEHDRKDAMQEIFAHVFVSLHRFDITKGDFKSWVSRLAINQSINLLKKNKHLKFHFGLELLKNESEDMFDYHNYLTREDIENMLLKMPSGYRTIFLLKVIDNYSHKEISELLDISRETSRSQLMRAISWIKKNIVSTSNSLNYEAL